MQKQVKILITDDAAPMRSLIKGALVKAGYSDFDEAENGLVALEKLKKDRFHLVICDWDMPSMDGLEVLRKMRQDDAIADIPFILVTSSTEADKVVKAIEEGVDDYIIKPLKPDNFTKRVKDVLSNAQ